MPYFLTTRKPGAARWLITFPDGHSEITDTLTAFAREHNLVPSDFYRFGRSRGVVGIRLASEKSRDVQMCTVHNRGCAYAHKKFKCRCEACRNWKNGQNRQWAAKNPGKVRASKLKSRAKEDVVERRRKQREYYYRAKQDPNKLERIRQHARNRVLKAYELRHKSSRLKARIEANRRIIEETKNRPCADCGLKYSTYVMDFDHVRGVKHFNICAARSHATEKLLAEIAKCEVVCSNCHRIRTHERKEVRRRLSNAA